MMKILLVTACILFAQTFQSIAQEVTRELKDFSELKVKGSIDLKLIPSETNSITIKKPAEVSDNLETKVVGNELVIQPKKGFKKYGTIEMILKFKSINSINILGSGDILLEQYKSESFSYNSRGSGDTKLFLDCNSATINLSGSGDCSITGSGADLSLKTFGSGNVHALDYEAKNITIESKGSGNIDINASVSITGSSVGSGDIECKGKADVDINNLGSGTITKR